ncbi:protein of unknown function [Kyrpidia spormannii]|uniref:Uncharacterized protein n=2 Tax=Kyrpidia spormannii TaxID=2055160 RepID=A0ACA8Z534_9BACL|nr:protein of unknown function [Kyrpidia spormannii]CAB3390408.1 protein of unknown function [Kyrpidia spormannii]
MSVSRAALGYCNRIPHRGDSSQQNLGTSQRKSLRVSNLHSHSTFYNLRSFTDVSARVFRLLTGISEEHLNTYEPPGHTPALL